MPRRASRGPRLRFLPSPRAGSAQAKGVKFGRKPKLTPHQCKEALKRRAAGETLASRLAE
jgi:hypothetical protein